MSATAAHDEVLSLLFGARAGVATGLTWTWYLLAGHPESETRLHEEIDELLDGRVPTADDVSDLRFARMIVAESMRLFPPAWLLKRRAAVDLVLGGYTVPAGTTVLVSPYVVHRDARFHPNPERFVPERFARQLPSVDRYAYFPFGGGAMGCIGESYAWMAAPLVLATIAQRWRLRPRGERIARTEQRDPRTSWVITLKPRGGLVMVPEPRGHGVLSEAEP
jgi:cytochrome P450